MESERDARFPQLLRDLRLRQGLTVRELARRIGRSVGFVSQIERGLSQPSVEDVQAVGKALGVHSMYFLQQAAVRTHPWASRPQDRRTLGYAHGITDQVVSPALSRKFIMLETCLEAGAGFAEHNILDSDEQAGYVLEGVLELWVNDEAMSLRPGDAFQFASSASSRCINPGPGLARVLWIYS
ncbi:MAG: XRE family transcriptional regulator [Burkholderiales bacterium]|nr:MAG: XRE family transcriptional regulator [Burkholderiales bacterium]